MGAFRTLFREHIENWLHIVSSYGLSVRDPVLFATPEFTMKLLRIGKLGHERPAPLDTTGHLRDL